MKGTFLSQGLCLTLVAAISGLLGLLIGLKLARQRQIRQLESFKHEARTDALTGLFNRRGFKEILARRVGERNRRKSPVSLLILDVDEFKILNDRFGHPIGDAVLCGVGDILSRQVRQSDVVARPGGDEFVIVMPATDLDDAGNVAERIRRLIASHCFLLEKSEIKVSVSVGVAEATPGESAEALYKRADQAVYAAKQAGRNNSNKHDGRVCRRIQLGESAFQSS